MLRLVTRTARSLTFLVVVPDNGNNQTETKTGTPTPSSVSGIVRRRILQPPSPYLAWSLSLPPGEYALVRGDQYFCPRRLVRSGKGDAGLLLLSLQSKGG